MKRKIIEKVVLAAALGVLIGGSAVAGTNSDAIAKLEAAKSSYLASVRMEALETKNAVPQRIATGPASAWLTRVSASKVNMATNRFENEEQQSVVLDGKTYYTAGRAFTENLLLNPSTRFTKDPLSSRSIDKAEAVIYADASGRAYYFESEKSFGDFVSLATPETVYGYSEPK